MREKVYLETTIPSYLTARPSREVITLARQQITHDWWKNRRHVYELFISEVVVAEAARGNRDASERRVMRIKDISCLSLTDSALTLASTIMSEINVPSRASDDSLHIAIASVHKMDYIVTWNFRHLANPHNYRK